MCTTMKLFLYLLLVPSVFLLEIIIVGGTGHLIGRREGVCVLRRREGARVVDSSKCRGYYCTRVEGVLS